MADDDDKALMKPKVVTPAMIIPDALALEVQSKLEATPAGWVFVMTELLSRPTPKQLISYHEGPMGSTLAYVEGSYAKATRAALTRLGIMSDFEIVQTETDKAEDLEVSCLGRLTFKYRHDGLEDKVTSMQWGGCKKRSGMTWGSARKGAATDCEKKCLSEFGWAADVYATEPEYRKEPDKGDLRKQSIETLYSMGVRAGMTKEQTDKFVADEANGQAVKDLSVKDLAAVKRKITKLGGGHESS